jgi:hypothetical protein
MVITVFKILNIKTIVSVKTYERVSFCHILFVYDDFEKRSFIIYSLFDPSDFRPSSFRILAFQIFDLFHFPHFDLSTFRPFDLSTFRPFDLFQAAIRNAEIEKAKAEARLAKLREGGISVDEYIDAFVYNAEQVTHFYEYL